MSSEREVQQWVRRRLDYEAWMRDLEAQEEQEDEAAEARRAS